MTTPTVAKTEFYEGMPLSEEQFMRLAADATNKYELVEGKLQIMPPSGQVHAKVVSRIDRKIGNWVEANEAGETYSEGAFRLAPQLIQAPDVGVVVTSRVPQDIDPKDTGPFPGAPDLAVEVLSAASSYGVIADRIEKYFQFGTRLIWVVIPYHRRIEVHRADGTVQRLGDDDVLSGEDVIPGFEIPVRELWPKSLGEPTET